MNRDKTIIYALLLAATCCLFDGSAGTCFAEPLSRCLFTVRSVNPGDWTSTFLAYVDESAGDDYLFGEDVEFVNPPGRGVAMLSQPSGAAALVFLDARGATGGSTWWGGDAAGPALTLRLVRYGYAPADAPVPTRITWNLSDAGDRTYILYDDDDGQEIVLTDGVDHQFDVPAGGLILRLHAYRDGADEDEETDEEDDESSDEMSDKTRSGRIEGGLKFRPKPRLSSPR